MKRLLLDVECSPNIATVWGIWGVNIGINQLQETSRVLCYSAKWYGEEKILFGSEHDTNHFSMIEELHELLSEADAVIHYNGTKFDIPVINREFLKYGMNPVPASKQIDLLKVVKKNFRFVSNKLDHVAQELKLGKKLDTGGHELWLDCMAGDDDAWERMEEYNKQDVVLLERLYNRLVPWISNHPNFGLYSRGSSGDVICTNCGSHNLQKRGYAVTKTVKYQRYQCTSCGTWQRERYSALDKDQAKSILTQLV